MNFSQRLTFRERSNRKDVLRWIALPIVMLLLCCLLTLAFGQTATDKEKGEGKKATTAAKTVPGEKPAEEPAVTPARPTTTSEKPEEGKEVTSALPASRVKQGSPEKPKEPEGTKAPETATAPSLTPFGYDFFQLAPSTFAPVPDIPAPSNYTLAPGDVLKLRYWSETIAQVSLDMTVSQEGQVFIPEVGPLVARGLNLDQFRKAATEALSGYFRNVKTYITLSQLRSLRVFVAGEAARPGGYVISSLSTAFNALYVAGGPSARGSLRDIRLMRNNREVGRIDVYKYLLEGDKKQDYPLEAGDTLFIPVVGARVAVQGEVKRPAIYELKGSEKLKEVLQMAGGIAASTYLKRIQIDRIQANQEHIALDIDVSALMDKQDEAKNIALQDGDSISVLKVLLEKMNAVTLEGNVERPGDFELKPGMTIKDLIAAAEGLKKREETYLSRADIFRRLPDKTVKLIPIDLSKALEGASLENLVLSPMDRVVIYTAKEAVGQRTITISGNIEKPGAYNRTIGMTVKDLLFLGKPLNDTYLQRADLYRYRPDNSREILALDLDQVQKGDTKFNLALADRDELRVFSWTEVVFPRVVTISGHVENPATFERTAGMRVKDLVFLGKLLRDAYLTRADLTRLKPDGSKEITAIKLDAVLQGSLQDNLELADRDELRVYSWDEARWAERTVVISGPVQRPGRYERKQNMRLKDLIFEAGGLLPQAGTEAEIGRAMSTEGTQLRIVDLNALLTDKKESENLLLQDRDEIQIKALGAFRVAPKTVTIAGEVKYPGTYALKGKKERISELIQRVGGFTEDAFPQGAVFYRQMNVLVSEDQRKATNEVKETMQQAAEMEYKAWLAAQPGGQNIVPGQPVTSSNVATTGTTNVSPTTSPMGEVKTVAKAREITVVPPSRIPISLQTLLEKPNSQADLLLEDGDLLVIPRTPITVSVTGAVVRPISLIYEPGKSIDYYVSRAGGYSNDANAKRTVIVKADGRVLERKKLDRIGNGDIIVVPTRALIYEKKQSWWEQLNTILSTTANAATTLYVVSHVGK